MTLMEVRFILVDVKMQPLLPLPIAIFQFLIILYIILLVLVEEKENVLI